MTELSRDNRDSKDRAKENKDGQYMSFADERGVTYKAIAESRKGSMNDSLTTIHKFFGTPKFFDNSSLEHSSSEGQKQIRHSLQLAESATDERADKPQYSLDKLDKLIKDIETKESREILDRIVIKNKSVSDKFISDLKDSLSDLPAKDLKTLEQRGIKVHAVKNIPGFGPGPGVFDDRGGKIWLAENGDTTFPDGTHGLMRNSSAARGMAGAHEIGHALSFVRGSKKHTPDGLDSSDSGFRAAQLADRKAGWSGIKSGNHMQDFRAQGLYQYHAQQREEAYAQAYAMESKLVSAEQQNIWRNQFPKTSEWMHRNQDQTR